MDHPAPTVGRTVNFVLHEGKNAGQIRSAIITRVWRPADDKAPTREAEVVQLTVNLDGSNDLRPQDLLQGEARELLSQIERCGASPDLTTAVVMAARLQERIARFAGGEFLTHLAVSSAHFDSTGTQRGTWHWPTRG